MRKRILLQSLLTASAAGLAVLAMPVGSPEMEGSRKDPVDVLLIQADGPYSVYRHYNGK